MSKTNNSNNMIEAPIEKIKENRNNPRFIRDEAFLKLIKSIREFPQMLNKRPLVCYTDENGDYVILGGNQRYKASIECGLKSLPVILADDWSEEQRNEFLIKDNLSSGEWDFEEIAMNWDNQKMQDWGLINWDKADEPDYSILDADDEKLNAMEGGVKKAIMIEFDIASYPDAYDTIKFWREQKLDIGKFLVEKLKEKGTKK